MNCFLTLLPTLYDISCLAYIDSSCRVINDVTMNLAKYHILCAPENEITGNVMYHLRGQEFLDEVEKWLNDPDPGLRGTLVKKVFSYVIVEGKTEKQVTQTVFFDAEGPLPPIIDSKIIQTRVIP